MAAALRSQIAQLKIFSVKTSKPLAAEETIFRKENFMTHFLFTAQFSCAVKQKTLLSHRE